MSENHFHYDIQLQIKNLKDESETLKGYKMLKEDVVQLEINYLNPAISAFLEQMQDGIDQRIYRIFVVLVAG